MMRIAVIAGLLLGAGAIASAQAYDRHDRVSGTIEPYGAYRMARAHRAQAYRRLALQTDDALVNAYARAYAGDTQAYAFERHQSPVAENEPTGFDR